jgi:thioester reductase-like protein
MKHIFITGASGFVGSAKTHKTLYLMICGSVETPSKERAVRLFGENSRIIAVSGDITQEKLGLSPRQWNKLSAKIDCVYHSAATIHFNLPYDEAHEINVNGTRRVLEFAENCRNLTRFIHISTAYTAGKTPHFSETQLDIGQDFANTYEQTKLQAELLVQEHIKKGMSCIIMRPSIISGNSKTGEITKSNLIYEIINQLKNGIFKDFICDENSALNIVPVDYCVDAMVHIVKSDSNLGRTFNLVADKNMNIKQMLEISCRELGIEPLRIIPVNEAKTSSKLTRLALSVFLNYIEISHTFDDSCTKQALQGSGIVCPDLGEDFTVKIMDYFKEVSCIS